MKKRRIDRNDARSHILLLTGRPGIGKTTALRAVAERLRGRRVSGFYTEEIRERGERRGFRAVTLDGREATMAHIGIRSRARVSKYGVDVSVVDDLARATLATGGADVYLVDEIGKMECLSPRFVSAMQALLDAGPPVVATVALRGTGFIAAVKQRPDAECWQLTMANRAGLPDRALEWLSQRFRCWGGV
jgi:nucleoside-triphosphatase